MTNSTNSSTGPFLRPQRQRSWLGRLFGFIGWVLTGFGLLGHLGRKKDSEEVVVYAVHQSFFLWALILVGFVGAVFVSHWPGSAVVWGWVYLWVLMYTLVTVLFDVNTTRFVLWVGIFSFLWLAARYLEDLKHIPVVTDVLWYFASLRPQLSSGFAMIVSWLLLPAWIGSLFQTFSWGRKMFTPNSIEEWHLGEGSEVTDRSGLKFRTRYRDIFESVLGLGAGDLEAINGSGQVVKRWPNILFLAFTWKQLDAILHQRASLVDNTKAAPVEVENANRPT
jgi:hypothetical protein